MPFVTKEKRKEINRLTKKQLFNLLNECDKTLCDKFDVGDICYYFYKKMVKQWKKCPRWRTAHKIFKEMTIILKSDCYPTDVQVAYELAWQVFFNVYVMPYEQRKRKENGDI